MNSGLLCFGFTDLIILENISYRPLPMKVESKSIQGALVKTQGANPPMDSTAELIFFIIYMHL
ncbi:hypothetical protein RchiOBHm_Chr6g0303001 [Rosa chinensis]|uniref:Uncharacterized protein n=1 Tax=Rosa chinensis TaxID=74649 RepID=A0A2P6PZ49_ROSCH|nr:hypothetical protein RchiOBHm_Chr6g0303001 [Rosa chinensis]